MSKVKLSDFKKYLATMGEKELRNELIKLFNEVKQVKEVYAQHLLSKEDKQKILEDYKKQIEKEFWTPSGNPRTPNNTKIRTLINNFEKLSDNPSDVIELLLYRVLTATEFANMFGGAPDAVYNASQNAFKKAIDLIYEHQLLEKFKDQCLALFEFNNLDYWYTECLEEIYEDAFGK